MNKEMLVKLLTGVFAKLVRYGVTTAFGAKLVNALGTAGHEFNPDNFVVGSAGVAATLAWSYWEDRVKKKQADGAVSAAENKEIQPGITRLPLLPFLLALGLLIQGCATTPEARTARVARLAGAAAEIGSQVYLMQHPEDRGHFEKARAALAMLEATGNYDPAQFAAALQSLPIKELKDKNGVLIVGVATVAWTELSAEMQPMDRTTWVKPVIKSVSDGLSRALAATEAAPPAGPPR